ncbi:MAG: 8-oxo-dGTP diphosphatase [Candidatus Tokpelaia sp. JSC188]|nr:MAG: 8-oxo-dGTP diphosphatase [Candidatus Tokpelaia sp. JSC188]
MKRNPLVLVVACVLINKNCRILFAQRPKSKSMAGLWELPGGKIKLHEKPEETLIRELYEELGLVIRTKWITPFVFTSYAYDTFHLLMPLYVCRKFEGTPKPKEGQVLRWLSSDEFANYPMPAADLPLLPFLCKLLA